MHLFSACKIYLISNINIQISIKKNKKKNKMDEFDLYFKVETDQLEGFLQEAGDLVEEMFSLDNDYIHALFSEKINNLPMQVDFYKNYYTYLESGNVEETLDDLSAVTKQILMKSFVEMILSKYPDVPFVGPTILRQFYSIFSMLCGKFCTVRTSLPESLSLWFQPAFFDHFEVTAQVSLTCLSLNCKTFTIKPPFDSDESDCD